MAQSETEHQTARTQRQRHTILDQPRKDTKRKEREGKIKGK